MITYLMLITWETEEALVKTTIYCTADDSYKAGAICWRKFYKALKQGICGQGSLAPEDITVVHSIIEDVFDVVIQSRLITHR